MFGRIATVAGKVLGTVAVAAAVAVSSGAAPVAAELTNLDQVVTAAAPVVNSFWANYFEEEGLEYQMPPLNYYNTPADPGSTKSGCGELPPGNAFYCSVDAEIYLDYQLLNQVIDKYGDASVAMAITHEWGHHIHFSMGMWVTSDLDLDEEGEVLSIQAELTADCYSGVAMANFEVLGMLEEGDIEEVYVVISELLGDHPGTDPTDHGAHGDSKLRKKVFKAGFRSGDPAACEAMVEKIVKDVI